MNAREFYWPKHQLLFRETSQRIATAWIKTCKCLHLPNNYLKALEGLNLLSCNLLIGFLQKAVACPPSFEHWISLVAEKAGLLQQDSTMNAMRFHCVLYSNCRAALFTPQVQKWFKPMQIFSHCSRRNVQRSGTGRLDWLKMSLCPNSWPNNGCSASELHTTSSKYSSAIL
jgi:hypothetical protein